MAIVTTPRKSWKRLTQQEVNVMCNARRLGLTLQEIVSITGRSLRTVYMTTIHIPHVYRHQGYLNISKQSGLLGFNDLKIAACNARGRKRR